MMGLRQCVRLLLLPLCLLGGCTTASIKPQAQFVAFDEPQQSWPMQPWGLVHLVDGFPVYGLHQYPPQPYEVRGVISVSAGRDNPTSQAEHLVVQRARQEGAQAAICIPPPGPLNRLAEPRQDFLVIAFKTNGLAAVLERINVYLALNPSETNLTDRPQNPSRPGASLSPKAP
jgi:hypothetical protein